MREELKIKTKEPIEERDEEGMSPYERSLAEREVKLTQAFQEMIKKYGAKGLIPQELLDTYNEKRREIQEQIEIQRKKKEATGSALDKESERRKMKSYRKELENI